MENGDDGMGMEHRAPLTDAALAVLERMMTLGAEGCVFPGRPAPAQ